MELIVDDRERAVFDFLEAHSNKYHINYKIQRSEVGDYAIVYKGYILLVIERKTWEDLASSIRDGRKENIKKLLDIREKTGCQIAYLIEGDATPPFNKKFGRIPVVYLRAHLDHLAFRDGVHMFYTKNQEYTVQRLFELAKNYLSLKDTIQEIDDLIEKENEETKKKLENEVDTLVEQGLAEKLIIDDSNKVIAGSENQIEKTIKNGQIIEKTIVPDKGNINKLKEKIITNNTAINEQMLRCIPSVGSIISSLLAESGVSIKSIYTEKHTAEQIAVLKYSGGVMIGLERANKIIFAKKLIDSISKPAMKMKMKILQCIPLVSETAAEVILKSVSIADIITGVITKETIAELDKTEKTKIGKKAAENIITWLTK